VKKRCGSVEIGNPLGENANARFGSRGDCDRLPGVSARRFCGKATALCEGSGCLRAIARPKQFEQLCVAQISFHSATGFRDSA